MEKEVVAALEKQVAHELYAAHSYMALAYWAEVHHYAGFASFFHQQVKEEHEHVGKLLKFLADREVLPAIGVTNAPRNAFSNLIEVARHVYDLERVNTAGIHAAYEIALRCKDYATQVMLHWFIQEQVEEEAWSDKLVAKVQEATCSGAMSSLDRHLMKELRGKSGGE